MKVLDKDRHNLSNVEVLDWINRSQKRFERQGRDTKLPKNYVQVTSQVKEYLERKDGPLEDTEQNIKARHKPATLELARKLKAPPWNLLKGEILMILNHRPRNRDVLATLVEESDTRFPNEEQLDEMLQLIADHIGPVADLAELQALKARFEQEKLDSIDKIKTKPGEDAVRTSSTKVRDGELVPLESLTVAEAAALPTEEEMDTADDDEESALWALMEKEAKQNMEGGKDIEDSPLTKYMKQLKLSRDEQRQP